MGTSKEDINKMLNEKVERMKQVLDLLEKSRERLNEEELNRYAVVLGCVPFLPR